MPASARRALLVAAAGLTPGRQICVGARGLPVDQLGAHQAEAGRATFVCEQKPKRWRIIHVHASQVLPWDH
jgi:hypothetical protein